MAITVLSEFSFTKDTITSTVVSAFMKPVLYFKVSAGSSLNAAEIEIQDSPVQVIEAIYLETVTAEEYFIVDLEKIMKYVLPKYDGGDQPDDLPFTDTAEDTDFEYGVKDLEIDIYYDRGEVGVQTLTVTNFWAYLAEQIPSESGFNLWNLYTNRKMNPLKWSNDTYNALFFFTQNGTSILKNHTTGKSFSIIEAGDIYQQFKFAKRIQESYTLKRNWQVDDIDAAGVTALDTITPSAGDGVEKVTIKLKKTTFSDDSTTGGRTLSRINYTDVSTDDVQIANVKDNNIKNQKLENEVDSLKTVTNIQTFPLSLTSETGQHINVEGVRVEIEFNENEYDSILEPGVNVIEILTPEASTVIEIDYDPYCENYVNVAWQHPELGYVSYPFESAIIESQQIQKGYDVLEFLTSLQSVNSFKTSIGYDKTVKLSISTRCEKKYLPLLKELHASRHVYLFVGQTGDPDTTDYWVECEVSGTPSINESRNQVVVNVELKLPEHLNIKF